MAGAVSQRAPNGSIRSWHWGAALLLAIALHLFAYLGLVSGVDTAPVLRGGGSFGAEGDQAAPEGLRVGLAPPSRPPVPTSLSKPVPAPSEQTSVTADSVRPEASPAAAVPEAPAPAPNPAPLEPAAALPQAAETPPADEAEEVVEVPEAEEATRPEETDPGESTLVEPGPDEPVAEDPVVAEAATPQEVAELQAAPPVPSRKPAPPALPKPELGLLEERLPLEAPAPTDDLNSGEISELRHVQGEGALGTASLNSDGQIPKLNYKDQVLLWVKRHGSYPRDSHRFRQEGTVLLHFVVDRSGEILYYNIRKSSGFYLLDQAVKKMMERASPVPPIPERITQDEIEFTVPVQFLRNLG